MNPVEDLLESVRDFSDEDLPKFTDCIRVAFDDVLPVFVRPRYADFFFHCASTIPNWLPRVVLANADAESDGSAKLYWLWRGSSRNAEIARDVIVHAKDESRHSRLFVSLVDTAFPGAFSRELLSTKRANLFRIDPDNSDSGRFEISERALIDHMVQMNMGEIRTRIHMILLAPVIYTLTPESAKNSVRRLLEGLVTDEVRHISYTARFIERWCENGDAKLIRSLYSKRLADFHQVTVAQTEASIEAYGGGKFPDLLEI